jgi:hypothetical protein
MKNHHSAYSSSEWATRRLTIFIAYLTFGALHELAHLLMASWLLPVQSTSSFLADEDSPFTTTVSNIPKVLIRILLGRCVTIPLSTTTATTTTTDMDDTTVATAAASLIRHSGWITSVTIAILCHLLYKHQQQQQQTHRLLISILSPNVVLAAYITAIEGISTDLLGWTPHHDSLWYTTNNNTNSSSSYLTFFCGNFGILLLNPSWLSVDGGRTALDVLEKMVS